MYNYFVIFIIIGIFLIAYLLKQVRDNVFNLMLVISEFNVIMENLSGGVTLYNQEDDNEPDQFYEWGDKFTDWSGRWRTLPTEPPTGWDITPDQFVEINQVRPDEVLKDG